MAINFPSTTGQATDGSYTYTVAGIVYAWNGSSWAAAGAGASATDRTLFSVTNASAGSTTLSYNNSNGVFTYTPPDLSGYLTAEADTLADVTGRGATTNTNLTFGGTTDFNNTIQVADNVVANFGASQDGRISYTSSTNRFYVRTPGGTADLILGAGTAIRITNENGLTDRAVFTASGATITGTLTAGGLTYPTSNGTSGYVLTSDGAGNVSWTAGGLQSRATTSVTQSIVNGASADVSITAPSGYALLSIETSHAAWVTLYSDTSSRTLDAPRAITNDPLPGSGVLAEVITTGAATQKVTPGIICFNSAGAGQNTTYAKIENRSGSTNNITVTLTYITLEA